MRAGQGLKNGKRKTKNNRRPTVDAGGAALAAAAAVGAGRARLVAQLAAPAAVAETDAGGGVARAFILTAATLAALGAERARRAQRLAAHTCVHPSKQCRRHQVLRSVKQAQAQGQGREHRKPSGSAVKLG